MDFSHTARQDASKLTKVAVVGMLHVIIGLGLVRSMSTVHLQMPKAMETILQLTPEKPKPPEPQ